MKTPRIPEANEGRSIYERLIQVMLDFAEVADLDKIVHRDFMGYGSAAHEFFRTREAVKKMAVMQAEQLQGGGFRYTRMPVAEKVFAGGEACLILERFRLFLPSSNHQLEVRLSVLLEKIDGKWLVTHFHGSSPDSDIAEDEAFPEQGLRRKNEALEAKIRERTRELEVEAALERARAQSMLMQHSSELGTVSNVFHEQLLLLGIDSEFSFVWLPDESREDHLFWTTWTETVNGELVFHNKSISYPLDLSDPYNAACIADWESGVAVHEHFVPPEDIDAFFGSWKELLEGASHLKAEFFQEGIYYTEAFMKYGCFGIDIRRPLMEEEKSVLHRFAIEFERAYTRFLELKKAEAQTRQAEIELALERVRASTMAMHDSGDLAKVASVLFEQMRLLGGDLFSFGIVLCDKDSPEVEQWHSLGDKGMMSPFKVPVGLDYIHQYRYDQWKAGEPLFSIEIPEDYIQEHFQLMFDLPSVKASMDEVAAKGVEVTVPAWEIDYGASFSHGYLLVSSLKPFGEDHIFPRFARVFEQAYTRFLDLQKAEAQAREAEIEVALERVRSRSMGMQQSGELKEVIRVIFDQLGGLNINAEHAGIVVDFAPGQDWNFWIAETQDIPSKITVPYLDSLWDRQYTEAKEKGRDFFTTVLNFAEKNAFYEELLEHIPGLTKEIREFYLTCPGLAISTVVQEDIGLYIENFLGTPYSETENTILRRFGAVFQQTYTRFLDLKRAEAQAREAQIELGLERVRARAMAMQKSGELSDLVATVLDELTKLDFSLTFCIINIYNVPDGNMVWAANPREGKAPESYYMKFEDYPFHHAMMREWKAQTPKFVYVMEGKEKEIYDAYLYNETEFRRFPDEIKKANRAKDRYVASFTFSPFGGLQTVGDEPLSEESLDILYRFGKVFDQTYTRFLDLQKAEQQAREAQIEASLERLRSKAMSMQQSDELHEVLAVLFEQFDILGIRPMSTHMTILDIEHNEFTFRETGKYGNRSFGEHTFALDAMDTWKDMVESWQNSEPFTVNRLHFPKESLPQVWEVFQESFASMPEESRIHPEDYPEGIYHTAGKHPFGYMGMNQVRPATKEEEQIVVKFANEFGRVYQRFLDLQKAEAQAREAQIESALERVRSRTMAMQHSDELAEASHLLDKEVRGLGIQTWGCAFNIYRDQDSIEWFGNEAGLLPTYTVPRKGIFREYYERGQKGESLYIKEIAGEECIAHYEYMSTLPVVGDVLRQLKATNGSFPSYQIDHVVYFKYGYLLFITREDVPEAHDIFKRFAKVFEQTYTRFLDLQLKEEQAVKLVEEKQRLEKTLSDLQATQQQLIHAEKMASLGELTAGIAHEIQNPLNFVNNFSEVSRELLEEMIDELKNGDTEEVDAIAQDVIQNLEKILHHGKRADGIVKGMLQHSRSGEGKKEPTDVNALADEYLRLAYHGLRAKDKSFNAHMETDFDSELPKVSVIPQDLGRVLLNLITNAFHAVNDRKEKESDSYEPTVWVRTERSGTDLHIAVRDNGSGIPQAIRDKIFQPFFTTKPTGEGTGLGLSMSYDIINKGHGGDLEMKTTEGEGSVFTIKLPMGGQ